MPLWLLWLVDPSAAIARKVRSQAVLAVGDRTTFPRSINRATGRDQNGEFSRNPLPSRRRVALTGGSARDRCEVTMQILLDNARLDDHGEFSTRTAPVEDLLLVYLGQSSGSRAPEPARRNPTLDSLDLWDYLGDFA